MIYESSSPCFLLNLEYKSISVLVLPIKDDFYGFTEDIEETMAKDGCYNIFSNETALEFLYNENIQLQNINDFLIGKIGRTVGVITSYMDMQVSMIYHINMQP